MAAGHHKLANLTLIIDRNTLQQGARVAETNDVEPLADKFRAFGWEVVDVDGHDPSALIDALTRPEGARQAALRHRPYDQGQGRLLHGGPGRLASRRADQGPARPGDEGIEFDMSAEASRIAASVRLPRRLRRRAGSGRRAGPARRHRRQRQHRLVEARRASASAGRSARSTSASPSRTWSASAPASPTAARSRSSAPPPASSPARALEQIKADVAYTNANVKLVGQSPGVGYGELGPTHHSIEDFAWLRVLPNLAIVSPADPWETAEAVKAAALRDGPVFLRISRFGVPQLAAAAPTPSSPSARRKRLREGGDVAIIANGVMVARALAAAEALAEKGVGARVVNMASIAPLDVDGDSRRRRPRRDRHRRGAFDPRRPRRRGRGSRRRLPAVPGAHPRLPRIHADRFGIEFLFENYGLTAAGIARAARRGDRPAAQAMSGYILAIDQGTTNTKALGDRCARADRGAPFRADAGRAIPSPAGSSSRARRSGARRVEAIDGCLAALPAERAHRGGRHLQSARNGACSGAGRPASRSGLASPGSAAARPTASTRSAVPEVEETVVAKTGLGLDPLFPAAKIGWLLDAYPEARALARRRRPLRRHGRFLAAVQPDRRRASTRPTRATPRARNCSTSTRKPGATSSARLFDAPLGVLPSVEDSDAVFGDDGRASAGLPPAFRSAR